MTLKPSSQTPYGQSKELYGIDGWLRLIQYHMGLYVLFTIYKIFTIFLSISDGWMNLLLIFDLVIGFFQLALIIVSFILMIKKLMLFRVFYTVLLSTFLLYAVLQILSGEIGAGIYNVVICVIWIVYLQKSVRVKNTFRKLNESQTLYEIKKEQKEFMKSQINTEA